MATTGIVATNPGLSGRPRPITQPGNGSRPVTQPGNGSRAPVVRIVSASVGAGHDGAASELATALVALGCVVTRHDFLDLLPARSGAWLNRTYAMQLRLIPRSWGLVLRLLSHHRVAAATSRMATGAARARLEAILTGNEALIVSTYPLASQALGALRTEGQLTAPVVTFLCDLSVHPLWIAAGVDHHIALHPAAQAEAIGHGAHDVAVCAPMVNRAFRPLSTTARQAARARWKLPSGPIALVVGGSGGVGDLARTAREIAASGLATPVTVCGHNAALHRRLTEAGVGVSVGWVDDMASLVGAADVVVQNAGGLTCLEAVAAGVPVITYRTLPGHGATNAAVLRDTGLSPWPRSRRAFVAALRAVVAAAPEPGRPPTSTPSPTPTPTPTPTPEQSTVDFLAQVLRPGAADRGAVRVAAS